ncbi:MAG: 2OG-Fe(II) oxygenase [Gammaproteobacteria bacterium]|nr:2OG-Fe(II) oxygenase [Gammaproteobacteria bacterium]
MNDELRGVIAAPISDSRFQRQCQASLERDGYVRLDRFLSERALHDIRQDSVSRCAQVYYCKQQHNVFLTTPDAAQNSEHPSNRFVESSKGNLTDDQIPVDSPLRKIYDAAVFREFLRKVLSEPALHKYADPLSSINVHFANDGQELGWHFDNSSFAVTLLIQAPQAGGEFQYVRDVRKSALGTCDAVRLNRVLDGTLEPETLQLDAGTLLLFRGRDTLHRVTPVIGETPRLLSVLAYNAEPGVALSETARMTFYGRLT